MAGLCHPNIEQLLEVINTEESLFILMEHVSRGDLWDYLQTHGHMTEGEAGAPSANLNQQCTTATTKGSFTGATERALRR